MVFAFGETITTDTRNDPVIRYTFEYKPLQTP
jgi:hypothetical protein